MSQRRRTREGSRAVSEAIWDEFESQRRTSIERCLRTALAEDVGEEPAAERAPLRWMVDFLVMTMLAPSTADLPKSGVRRVNRSFVCVLTYWRPCMGDGGVLCERAPSLGGSSPHAVRLPPLG